jgi:hypothetical protein
METSLLVMTVLFVLVDGVQSVDVLGVVEDVLSFDAVDLSFSMEMLWTTA